MRILHTMIRVGDLDRSIAFYTEILGMQLLRRQDYTDGRFTLAFVGYGSEDQEAVLELTGPTTQLQVLGWSGGEGRLRRHDHPLSISI